MLTFFYNRMSHFDAAGSINGFVQNPLAPTIKTQYQGKYEFWPIPQTEIDRNAPALIQNNGY